MDCELLLTEVSGRLEMPSHDVHLGRLLMSPKRRSAAVASRLPMTPAPDPGASAMVGVVWFGSFKRATNYVVVSTFFAHDCRDMG